MRPQRQSLCLALRVGVPRTRTDKHAALHRTAGYSCPLWWSYVVRLGGWVFGIRGERTHGRVKVRQASVVYERQADACAQHQHSDCRCELAQQGARPALGGAAVRRLARRGLRRPTAGWRVPCLLVGWLVGWLVGSLIGWLVSWLTGWLVGCWLVGWLAGCLFVWAVSTTLVGALMSFLHIRVRRCARCLTELYFRCCCGGACGGGGGGDGRGDGGGGGGGGRHGCCTTSVSMARSGSTW